MASNEQHRRELELVYRRTRYVVDDGDVQFTILIDSDNPGLSPLLADRGIATWAFLTAYNPYSSPLSAVENVARQAALAGLLDREKYLYYYGLGVGDDWEEPSFFILDITRIAAINIGKQFEQNAILWGTAAEPPELIWCV